MAIRKIHGVVIDADTIDGKNAQNAANQVPVLDASADVPLAQIPDTLTGKDAETVDGKNPGSASGLATLDASSVVEQAPKLHAAAHQNTGGDEVSVAALSGLLADDQHVLDAEVLLVAAALVHAARHQNGGADEISVAGLSGLLADDQHVLDAEVVAVALALAGGTMAGNIAMGTNKLTGLGAPAAQDDSLRYGRAEIRTNEIAAAAGILLTQLEDAVCSETEAKSFVTKEFFVPVFGGTTIERKGALLTLAGNEAFVSLIFPQDFIAITDIELIFLPNETGADMHISITTYYSAYNGGEDENVHTEMGPNRDIGATVNNQNLAHSISDLVDIAAPVAGDLLNVIAQFSLTAIDSNAFLRGIRLKYT